MADKNNENPVTAALKMAAERHHKFTFQSDGRVVVNGGVSTTLIDGLKFETNVEGMTQYIPKGKSVELLRCCLEMIPVEADLSLKIDKAAYEIGAVFLIAQWFTPGRGKSKVPNHRRLEFMLDAGVD